MNPDLSVLVERLEALAETPTWQRDWQTHLSALALVLMIKRDPCTDATMSLGMIVAAIAHPDQCSESWDVLAATLFAANIERYCSDVPEFEAMNITLAHWSKHLNDLLKQAPQFEALHSQHASNADEA